jgi:hypothetical protein
MRLLVSSYDVKVVNDEKNNEFIIKMHGPQDSPYQGVRFPLLINLINRIGSVARKSNAARPVSLQVTLNWIPQ